MHKHGFLYWILSLRSRHQQLDIGGHDCSVSLKSCPWPLPFKTMTIRSYTFKNHLSFLSCGQSNGSNCWCMLWSTVKAKVQSRHLPSTIQSHFVVWNEISWISRQDSCIIWRLWPSYWQYHSSQFKRSSTTCSTTNACIILSTIVIYEISWKLFSLKMF